MEQSLRSKAKLAVVLAAASVIHGGHAAASTIVAPVEAFASSEFISTTGNDYSIDNTINQSGLSIGYQSGLTDFATYLALNPKHTSAANGNEWFSEDYSKTSNNVLTSNISVPTSGDVKKISKRKASAKARKAARVARLASARSITNKKAFFRTVGGRQAQNRRQSLNVVNNVQSQNAATPALSSLASIAGLTVTYFFGKPTWIDAFVLWNEEFAGIGTAQLFGSLDGITYTFLKAINPVPSTYAPDGTIIPYGAQVFSFDLTQLLYFQLLITDCPGPPRRANSSYKGCGIGEVAFSSPPLEATPEVPIPAGLPLLASALGLSVWLGRRKRTIKSTSI
jgi:hypothetical protein